MTPRACVALIALASAAVSACRAGNPSNRPSPSASSSAARAPASSDIVHGGAPFPIRPPPVLELANAPGPAPSGAPLERAVRETAALALLADVTLARRLPVVDLEAGRAFDPALRDRVAPRIAVPRPTVRLSDPKTQGPLPKEVVQRVVRQHLGRYRECAAEAAPEASNLSGRVMLELSIEPSGRVGSVGIDGSTLNHSAVVRCIAGATRALEFPKADAVTRSTQSLTFEPPSSPHRAP